jgi:hypothetical protein
MTAVSRPKLTARLIARRLVAAALVLWLGGVGCFFGCETGVVSAAAPDGRKAFAEADSCPAFAGHDCCHRARAESGGGDEGGGSTARRTPGPLPGTGHCPLKGQSADSARKVSVADAPVAEAGNSFRLTPHAHTHARPAPHRLRVPDRGSTHLRCCVFLI